MKLNWGYGIAIFYASFMVVLLYFVIKTTTHDNSLVMENYYEQDLKYQSHYDRVVNTKRLKQPVTFKQNDAAQTIEIQFPEGIKNIRGTVQLFRPSTKHRDMTLAVTTDESKMMVISTKQLQPGRWKIKMNWEGDEKEFYSEEYIEL